MSHPRALLALGALALAEGFAPHHAGCGSILRRGSPHLCRTGSWTTVNRTPELAVQSGLRPARRAAGGLTMQTGESSTTKNLIVGILAFGFLFGALFPLINNGLRIGTAGQEMSGAATGMRQKELDQRLSKVRIALFKVLDYGQFIGSGL